jgi:Tfp pilus assembly protein PilF
VQRVNFKFLLILITALFVMAGGFVLLRSFQVSRHAGTKLELARKRLAEGKLADAMSLLSQYVKLRPRDREAYAEYAKLLLARALAPDATRNDVARAFHTLETAVRDNPADDDLRLQLVEFQLRVGRTSDAHEHLAVLEERLAEQPASGNTESQLDRDARGRRVRLLDATVSLAAGEFEEAAETLAAMIGYDLAERRFPEPAATEPPATPPLPGAAPSETDAFEMLATVLKERFEAPGDARRVLEELVKRRQDEPRAWLAMARWHRDHGEPEAAARAIAKALELAPEDPDCMLGDFELAFVTGRLDHAEATGRRAVELFPDDERAHRGLAAVLVQQGDLPEAEQVLLAGIERLPTKASLQLMLADVLLQQNKLVEAEQAVARMRDLYGSSSGPIGLFEARLLIAGRRWTEAKARLVQVRPQVLGNAELVRQVDLYLSECHAQLDEHDAQLEVNRRILSDDPGSLAARVGAAQALVSVGRTAEALAEFEALASALPPEQLVRTPQVWYPLLQLRLVSQSQLPVAERDWTGVDELLEALGTSAVVPASQLALLRAEALVRRGESQAARDLLEALATTDADARVWAAVVTLALQAEGPDAAATALGRVPASLRNDPALLAVEARMAARRPAAAARQELESIEQRAAGLAPPDAARLFATIAPLRLAAGDREAALRLWQQAADKEPEDLAIRESMLETAVVMQDLEQARACAAAIIEIAGRTSARSLVAEANVALLQARLRLAELEQQGSAPGKDPPAAVQPLLEQARNLLIEAEAERPGWGKVHVLFADLESLRGDRPAAIDRLRRAVAASQINPNVVRRLVALLYAENRLEEAQAAMAVLGDDGTQGLERISAEVELRAGKFDEAVALAEQSVAGGTENHEDLLWLGQLLARSGKVERAGEILKRATEVAADNPETWLAVFNYRLATGDAESALAALEQAAALMPEPRRQLALAQGYRMLGRIREAGLLIEQTARQWPDDLDVSRALAGHQIGKGLGREARQTLERILAAGDGPRQAAGKAWARRMLAELEAATGGYREFQRALELLRGNSEPGVSVTAEDLALEIVLLAKRPEPASWRRAVALLDQLAKRQPLSSEERLMRAQLRDKLGDWNTARDELVALVASPKTPPAYTALLIEKLLTHGETSSARTWLRRLEQSAPDAAITLALEAKLAMAENDRERAIVSARRLMPGGEVVSDNPVQLSAVGKLMEELRFPKAADRIYAKYAALDPGGLQARVEFLGREGRAAEALDLLEAKWESLSLERALSVALQVLRSQVADAAAAETAGRIGPWIEKAKRLDPGSMVIRLLDAEYLTLQGRESEAEGVYRDLLADRRLSGTQAAIVANNLAFHLAKADTAAEARTLIDAAIAELGPQPDLLDTRGLVRLAQGEAEAAAADLREAVLQPSAAKYLHLAAAELAAGDEQAARRALEAARREKLSATRLAPNDAALLEKLKVELKTEPVTMETAGG